MLSAVPAVDRPDAVADRDELRSTLSGTMAALDAVPDPVIVLDGQGLVVGVNQAARQVAPKQAIGELFDIGYPLELVDCPGIRISGAYVLDMARFGKAPNGIPVCGGQSRRNHAEWLLRARPLAALPEGCAATLAERGAPETDAQRRLAVAQSAGRTAVFDLDLDSGKAVWSPELIEMLGLSQRRLEAFSDRWATSSHAADMRRLERSFDAAGPSDPEGGEYVPARLGEARARAILLRAVHPGDRARAGSVLCSVLCATAGQGSVEFRAAGGEGGEERWVSVFARASFDAYGRPVRLIAVARDVSERKLAEEALRESGEQYRVIGDLFQYGVWIAGPDGAVRYVSQSLLDLLGMTLEQFQSSGWLSRVAPEEAETLGERWRHSLRTGTVWSSEIRLLGRDGRYHKVLSTGKPIRDRRGRITCWAGMNFDITAYELLAERTRELQAKDMLLKEIHHRVKNNLQVVSSLLSMQARLVADEQARQAFRESESRIRSMALIHEFLYQTADFDRIDVLVYLGRIADHLRSSFALPRVRCTVEGTPSRLDLNHAIPCGLIVNELVSNCYKHAFGEAGGNIRVVVERNGSLVRLSVEDDGKGLPADLAAIRGRSMGLQVVETLARRQLHGTLDITSRCGTRVSVAFAVPDVPEGACTT
jgi:PAS domain S-box-containing protein